MGCRDTYGSGEWSSSRVQEATTDWPARPTWSAYPRLSPANLPSRPELPGHRDLLGVNIPPGENAWRSVDRTIDHGPIAVKLDNFAAAHLPQQPSPTEIHQRIPAATE